MVLKSKHKLSEVIQLNPVRKLKIGENATFVSMSNITPNQRKISKYSQREVSGSKTTFKNGDTLLAKITPSLENGKTAFVDILKEGEVGHGSTEFIVLTGKEGKTLNLFVYYLMRFPEFREEAIRSMTGTSGRQRVQESIFEDYEIILPSLDNQKKICDILGNLDMKISNLQNQNKILEQIAQAIFKSWFIDFEGVKEFEDSELGKMPKGWKIDTLDAIAENPRNSIRMKDIASDILYVGLEHIPRGTIVLDNWENAKNLKSNKFKFVTNQILFGKLRPYFKKVGVAPIDGICSTDILVLDSKEASWLEFLLFVVSSEDFIQYANQSSTGTRMPRADWNYMKKYSIIIPTSSKILEFHEIIKNHIQLIRKNIFEIVSLKQIRDILLPKLMSGEIRV